MRKSIGILGLVSIFIFGALFYANNVTGNENFNNRVLKEKFGQSMVPSTKKDFKVSAKEAIELAYQDFASIHQLTPNIKEKAKADHVVRTVDGSSTSQDVWAITFEGGKYIKKDEYKDANYTVTVFVDTVTGEVLGGAAYDSRKYSSMK